MSNFENHLRSSILSADVALQCIRHDVEVPAIKQACKDGLKALSTVRTGFKDIISGNGDLVNIEEFKHEIEVLNDVNETLLAFIKKNT